MTSAGQLGTDRRVQAARRAWIAEPSDERYRRYSVEWLRAGGRDPRRDPCAGDVVREAGGRARRVLWIVDQHSGSPRLTRVRWLPVEGESVVAWRASADEPTHGRWRGSCTLAHWRRALRGAAVLHAVLPDVCATCGLPAAVEDEGLCDACYERAERPLSVLHGLSPRRRARLLEAHGLTRELAELLRHHPWDLMNDPTRHPLWPVRCHVQQWPVAPEIDPRRLGELGRVLVGGEEPAPRHVLQEAVHQSVADGWLTPEQAGEVLAVLNVEDRRPGWSVWAFERLDWP